MVGIDKKKSNKGNIRQDMCDLIYLIAHILNNSKPEPERVRSMNLEVLYQYASFHQIAALTACALETVGIEDSAFRLARLEAVRRNILFDTERFRITQELEKNGIWYMALKGVILKDLYPQAFMREMSDNDILIDPKRADDVKAIMESLDYTTVHFGEGYDDDYQKKPIFHFEMHNMPLGPESGECLCNYYNKIETSLITTSGFERRFSDEDFYIYMVAHEYKHFHRRGTGLRSLTDIYVFLQKYKDVLDWEYIKAELQKTELSDFEEKNRILALKVFSNQMTEQLTTDELRLLRFFITSGINGTEEHTIQNELEKLGRGQYIANRFFLSMDAVKDRYPLFYKYKILLPVLPLYRFIKGWKKAIYEIRMVIIPPSSPLDTTQK